ncbi:MAG TPA: NAD-dependent epimerase/dehydratase family protein [Cyclobacteriaceae bacterium]|nr:NAD-dependent epimerase/dehydratase family protein [Cyclobacteriaceae bacterium]
MGKRKVVITGGAGFIGSQLGYQLDQEGMEVVLIDDMSFGYEDNLVIDGKRFGTFVKADVRKKEMMELLRGADTVYHFAGISALPVCQENPYYAIDVNVAGTANVLEAARLNDVRRVVFASTSAIYENNTDFPVKESDPVSPHLVYSTSKQQAELLCKSYFKTYGLEVVIIRFFNVYGPHQDFKRVSPPLTSYLIRCFMKGEVPVLHSSGNQKRDYVYVDDLNRLNQLCMTHPAAPGNTFNAASGKSYSVLEIYDALAGAFKTDIKPVFHQASVFWDKYPNLFSGSRPFPRQLLEKEVNKFSLGDTRHTLETIGWKAEIDLGEGMSRTAAYARTLGF